MNDQSRRTASESFSGRAVSHKERLERKSFLLKEIGEEAAPDSPQPDIEALQTLVGQIGQQGAAFQSVVVAAVQIIERALCYERTAARAALSLGQQEKLNAMVDTAEQAAAILRSTLNAQGGTQVMDLCAEKETATPTDDQPWWFALTDALEALEEGTSRMSSLTTAQPSGSVARSLSQVIVQLLRQHHDALLLEADEWIS